MYIPDWSPCSEDPDRFDCSECELADEACVLRIDDGLRHFVVAQRHRWRGALDNEDIADEAVSRSLEILKLQRLSLPISILADLVGVDQDLGAGLRAALLGSGQVRETSPGMVGFAPSADAAGARRFRRDLHSGSQLEAEISGSPMFEREDQRRRLKRFNALRLASQIVQAGGTSDLEREIERLQPKLMRVRRWSLRDVSLYAVDGSLVPAVNDVVLRDSTSRLLSAIYALQLIQSGQLTAEGPLHADLVAANLRLVSDLAYRFAARGVLSFLDLFQYGSLGLMHAIDKFDPYRGFELSTYATYWIRQSMLREMADKGSLVRVPVHAYEAVTSGAFSGASRHAGSTVPEWVPAAKAALSPLLEFDPSAPIADLGAVEARHQVELLLVTGAVMHELRLDEQFVLDWRFGFAGRSRETLEEVGHRLGVTRERVRQIEAKALKRLRKLVQDLHIGVDDLELTTTHARWQRPARQKGVSVPGESIDDVRLPVAPAPERVDRNTRPKSQGIDGVFRYRSLAEMQTDLRVAGLGGWTPSDGFVPAPRRFETNARVEVEAARRRVLADRKPRRPKRQ